MTRVPLILSTYLFLLRLAAGLTNGLSEPGQSETEKLIFHLHSRATNKDGSVPVYKDPTANIEDRVKDLLPRMTIEEKVAQL